jgi:TonB family protein
VNSLRRTLILLPLALALASRGADTPAPLSTKDLPVEGIPYLKTWVQPKGVSDPKQGMLGGYAQIRFIVDENGRVTREHVLDASDPRLGEAALAAARQWTFTPALSEGRPAACSMDAPVYFDPSGGRKLTLPPEDQAPRPSERTPAAEKETQAGDYPDSLLARGISGVVRFKCTIAPDGRPAGIRVLFASHPDFVAPAVEAISRWVYTPAMQGDLPVASEIAGALTFKPASGTAADTLSQNSITLNGAQAPKFPPDIGIIADPVTPYDDAIKGGGGSATVSFAIDGDGRTHDVRVDAATAPGFGKALAAAVEASVFIVDSSAGNAYRLPATRHADFPALAPDAADASDPAQRVLAALRANQVGGAKGLDEKLTPIYRVAPEYPESARLRGVAQGHADIEFVIDRDGRARFPRVVAASDEDFGWSAATAVAQWVFRAPRRGGQPTDVRVRIPFDFKLPAAS